MSSRESPPGEEANATISRHVGLKLTGAVLAMAAGVAALVLAIELVRSALS